MVPTKGEERRHEAALSWNRANVPTTQRLEEALFAWRRSPSAPLADHIDQLSDSLTAQRPVITHAAWQQVCAQRHPVDLGPLLAALPPACDDALCARLDQLRSWPRDPRLSSALHRLTLQHLPRSSNDAFWRRALALLAQVGDARAASWLSAVLSEIDGSPFAGRALIARANELVVSLSRQASCVTPESKQLDQPTVILDVRRAPTDPVHRAVFADALLEQGDPRGELIILQSLEHPRRAQRRRVHELVRSYARPWLGRLSAALKPEGLRFEHGFVVAGRVSGSRALRELLGAVEWQHLRELDLRELARRQPPGTLLEEFLGHPVMNHLTRVSCPGCLVPMLLRARLPTAIERLELTGALPYSFELLELQRCAALPKLRELVVNGLTQLVPARGVA